ncbi:MAG: hypothetical protein KC444_01840 [Nitrosopumilus sp.]|nr:hypothetical protein [Nitrosopumilus sp.]
MPKSRLKKHSTKKQVYYRRKDYRNAIKTLKLIAKNPFSPTHQIAEKLGDGFAIPQNRVIGMMNHLKELDYCTEYSKIFNEKYVCSHCSKSYYYLVKRKQLDFALDENEKRKKRGNKFVSQEGYVLDRPIVIICDNCFVVPEPHDDEFKIRKRKHDYYKYWRLSDNGLFVVLTLLKGKSRENLIIHNQENTIFKLLKILLSSQKKDYVESFVSELKHTILHYPDLTDTVNRWEQQMNSILLNSEIDENRFSKLAEYVHEIKQRELRLNMVRWK